MVSSELERRTPTKEHGRGSSLPRQVGRVSPQGVVRLAPILAQGPQGPLCLIRFLPRAFPPSPPLGFACSYINMRTTCYRLTATSHDTSPSSLQVVKLPTISEIASRKWLCCLGTTILSGGDTEICRPVRQDAPGKNVDVSEVLWHVQFVDIRHSFEWCTKDPHNDVFVSRRKWLCQLKKNKQTKTNKKKRFVKPKQKP